MLRPPCWRALRALAVTSWLVFATGSPAFAAGPGVRRATFLYTGCVAGEVDPCG